MASRPEVNWVAVFQPEFLEDLSYWVETERRTAKRLLELVKATLRDPFKGIGNPEPLKYMGAPECNIRFAILSTRQRMNWG